MLLTYAITALARQHNSRCLILAGVAMKWAMQATYSMIGTVWYTVLTASALPAYSCTHNLLLADGTT
jgi:hypothetical protein